MQKLGIGGEKVVESSQICHSTDKGIHVKRSLLALGIPTLVGGLARPRPRASNGGCHGIAAVTAPRQRAVGVILVLVTLQ